MAALIGQLVQVWRTPDDIAVFARQARLVDMNETQLNRAGVPWNRWSREGFPQEPMVSLGPCTVLKDLSSSVSS